MLKDNKFTKKTALIILDGWGYNPNKQYNAIAQANTPTWNKLIQMPTTTYISASGNSVGLPKGQMGNSEVGHSTIGAGRVLEQDLVRINHAINMLIENSKIPNPKSNHDRCSNQLLLQSINSAFTNNNNIHILGLLSDGGVHSHHHHLHKLLKLIAFNNLLPSNTKVFIHAFLDGRDTPPKSATKYLLALNKLLNSINLPLSANRFFLSSLTGRFFAMDRDNRFERTKKIYDLLTMGLTESTAETAIEGLENAYSRQETDEFLTPTKTNQFTTIKDNDLIIFYNFRGDRAKQLCYALTEEKSGFVGFDRIKIPKIKLITFTKYSEDLKAEIAFPRAQITNTLSQCVAENNLPQLKIAETEKYSHVTFFFNGCKEVVFPLEDRLLIASPKVATYDLSPKMSAIEITENLIIAIHKEKYGLIVCNFANADMVGHTGKMLPTIRAIETIDQCLQKILIAIKKTNTNLIITADHGNAESMYSTKTKQSLTSHTSSLVPFVYYGQQKAYLRNNHGSLQDIAPTILALLGIKKPIEMTGSSLLAL